MKNKWYISALIIVLAIVGISLERGAVANQEIVIQFADTDLTLDQAQDAIIHIKGQLKTLNVEDIRIAKFENGTLKIKYYSDIDVSEIKKIFSRAIAVNHTPPASNEDDPKFPFDNESRQYLLDIYKIQDSNDFLGAYGDISESKTGVSRSTSFNAYAFHSKQDVKLKDQAKRTAYNAHRNPAIAIKNSSYKIPEVRAGPNT